MRSGLEDRNLRGWKPRGVNDVIMAIDDVEEQVAEVLTDAAFAPPAANAPGPALEIRPGEPAESAENIIYVVSVAFLVISLVPVVFLGMGSELCCAWSGTKNYLRGPETA